MQFALTAGVVLTMFAYAIPGFLLIKSKLIKPDQIKAFSVLLLYVCSPCLTLYSFQKIQFTTQNALNLGIFFLLSLGIQLLSLGIIFLIFKKKQQDVRYRVATIGAVFGNIGFMGVPLVEALLPNYPEAVAYSAIFVTSMNILSWTLGCAILTHDKKHAQLKKVFLNPTTLILLIALPLFFTNTVLPEKIAYPISLVGRMSTPVCMLILGMRFATVKLSELFLDTTVYLTSIIKLVLFPFLGFLLVYFLPISYAIKATLFLLCCCPTASMVLNYAEINKLGQKNAANAVLASTIFSMLTIPLMSFVLSI